MSRILIAQLVALMLGLAGTALAEEACVASCASFTEADGTHCSACPAHSVSSRDHDDDDDDDGGRDLHYPRLARARNAIHADHRGDCPKCRRHWEATGERTHQGDECDHCVSASKITPQCCWEAKQAGKACAKCGVEKSSMSCCQSASQPKKSKKDEGAMCSADGNCGS